MPGEKVFWLSGHWGSELAQFVARSDVDVHSLVLVSPEPRRPG